MPHPPTAKKRHRQSLRRRERNVANRTEARSAVRKAREAIAAGNEEEAAAAVRKAGAILDRAARKGVLHPNNASRRKSRLMRRLNTAGAHVAEAPKRRTRAAAKPAASRTRSTRTKKS